MAVGKWIGGFLGLMSGGPLGALAGFILGTLFDVFTDGNSVSTFANEEEQRAYQASGDRNGFLFSLMVLSAHIIHADGKIMHSEMEYVRRFLRNNFGAQAVSEGEAILLRLFDEKKNRGATWWNQQIRDICLQLAGAMPEEHRLQLIAYLCEIAKADGNIAESEVNALRELCSNMRLDPNNVEQMLGLGGTSLDDAYKALGITKEATDDEVRRAYKKMALQHHPDRVASLGEDVRKAAERKFQEIGEAKDRIYKARGMK